MGLLKKKREKKKAFVSQKEFQQLKKLFLNFTPPYIATNLG